jgi:ribose transport system permease protein
MSEEPDSTMASRPSRKVAVESPVQQKPGRRLTRRRPGPPHKAQELTLRAGVQLVEAGPVLILVLVLIAAASFVPNFLLSGNLENVSYQVAPIACLAIGQLVVIVSRGIDLSVGSIIALSGVMGALVAEGALGGSGLLVALAIILTGAAVGLVNGVAYVVGRFPHPFVVTLATLTIVRGLALLLADGQTKTGMPGLVTDLGAGKVAGVPTPAVVVAALAVLTYILMQRTQWGRWIYAIGGNPDAARRAGIPVGKVLISVYVLCGATAGLAGLIIAGRTDAGSPTAGSLAELDAITAVIIGGASFLGGRGTVVNALVGAFTIGIIRNAMNLLSIEAFWQLIVLGLMIVVAVEFDVIRARLEERMRVFRARGNP